MQYIMAPLENHYDSGFGAVGQAFFDGAKELAKASGGKRIFWNHLPEIYLLRHAIELFLKSGIIIIHRKLKIPYGAEPFSSSNPMLLTGGGTWKPLFKTHDLQELYAYWKKLITENTQTLTELTKYKPDLSVPKELDNWVGIIGAIDRSSDYFRYPVSKNRHADKEKSPFKDVPVESLFPPGRSEPEKDKVVALVTKNEAGEWVDAFKLDESTQNEVAKAGWDAAKMLSDFHALMRFELTDGW